MVKIGHSNIMNMCYGISYGNHKCSQCTFKQERKMSHFTVCYMINKGSKISVTHPKVKRSAINSVIQTEHFVKKTCRMQVIVLYSSA